VTDVFAFSDFSDHISTEPDSPFFSWYSAQMGVQMHMIKHS